MKETRLDPPDSPDSPDSPEPRPAHVSWLQDAALPLQAIGALSAVVFALNCALEILSLLVFNRAQQVLTATVLVGLSVWAALEGVLLRRKHPRLPRGDLLVLGVVQMFVELGRLAVSLWGPATGVARTYGIGVLEWGPLFAFLPVYALLFLAIGRSVIASHLVEIRAANAALLESHALLEQLATRDGLTGLHNRRHFEEIASAELARSRRYGQPVALVLFDIDRFKSINDRFGHPVGDRVLVDVSSLVRRLLRTSDTLARWGGEEFVVLTPQCTASDAAKVAEKLRAAIAAHSFEGAGRVTSSFGVAEFEGSESLEAWVKRADHALYAAKEAGRDQVAVAPASRPLQA